MIAKAWLALTLAVISYLSIILTIMINVEIICFLFFPHLDLLGYV